MGFEVKVYKDKTLEQGAKLCLSNRLYVNAWTMKGVFEWFLLVKPEKEYQIAIGFFDGAPIAAALASSGQVMAFCRKKFRGNGYGSKCVSKLDLGKNIVAGEGIKGSLTFWKKNNIPLDGGPYKWGV